jgi:hypothetical protein
MKYKRITAILAAAAIGCSLAGCKAPNLPGQPDAPAETSVQAPADPQVSNTVTGKVASIDGTKIKIELGELVARSSGGNSDSGDKKRPDRKDRKDGDKERPSDWTRPDGDKEIPSDWTRPDGENGNFPGGGSRGYTFKCTSKTAEYDLSGLKEITLEKDDDDTPDTVSEIKTGDVVVITLGNDGTPSALTVKNLSLRSKPSGRDGDDGKSRGNSDGKGSKTGNRKKDRDSGNREKKGQKTDETEESV